MAGLESRNAGLALRSRDSGDKAPRAETGRGRKGGCSYPCPFVGRPGLSGIGETEPLEDNPVRDKQSRGQGLAWPRAVQGCVTLPAAFPALKGPHIGRGELARAGVDHFPKSQSAHADVGCGGSKFQLEVPIVTQDLQSPCTQVSTRSP